MDLTSDNTRLLHNESFQSNYYVVHMYSLSLLNVIIELPNLKWIRTTGVVKNYQQPIKTFQLLHQTAVDELWDLIYDLAFSWCCWTLDNLKQQIFHARVRRMCVCVWGGRQKAATFHRPRREWECRLQSQVADTCSSSETLTHSTQTNYRSSALPSFTLPCWCCARYWQVQGPLQRNYSF